MFAKVFISLLLVFTWSGAATGPVARFNAGTPASFLKGLTEGMAPASFSLPSLTGEQINLTIERYHFAGGYLAATGVAPDSPDSKFLLKGDSHNLKGWMALKHKNTAYTYTTQNGHVYVEEISISKLFPVCRGPHGHKSSRPPTLSNESLPENPELVRKYAGEDLYKLQSLPGSEKVIWLDISRVMDGDTPIHIPKEEMFMTWQFFSASFSMFDVNVTTDDSVYDAAEVRNSGVNRFLDREGTSNCCIGCFGTQEHCETRLGIFPPDLHYPYGMTAVHETGHQMGLYHDGDNLEEYFEGFPEYQWSPVMGNNWDPWHSFDEYWDQHLFQWSKGEYRRSTNDQDDLNIITDELDYRPDDIPLSTMLVVDDTGYVDHELNRGQINSDLDSDTFTFSILTEGGHASLTIGLTEIRGSALDVDARIVDAATGDEIIRENPIKIRSAQLDVDLPVGDYELIIEGGSEGTALNGFTRYATMGFYAIFGNITGTGTTHSMDQEVPRDINNAVQLRGNRVLLNVPVEYPVLHMYLVSIKGKVQATSHDNRSIDLSGLNDGVYILHLETSQGTIRQILKY